MDNVAANAADFGDRARQAGLEASNARPGFEKTGFEKTGFEKTGFEKTGFERADFEQIDVDQVLDQVMRRSDTWRGSDCRDSAPQAGLATGYRELDEELYGNGWPLGQTIELLSDSNGLGAMGLFLPAMEALSEKGRWQVFIAPPFMPYAPLLDARGIDTQQVLLVHPQNRQDLLWSIEQALRSTTCSAVFAWLGAGEYRYSELRKLQLAAADSDTLSVLFRPRQAMHNHAPASLRLEMSAYRQVNVIKQRGGNQSFEVALGEDNDVPGQPQLWELPAYPDNHHVQVPALGA